MITVQHITYLHPNRELLFENINFSVNRNDKIALVGNNGAGKSTLLKIISGILKPSGGTVRNESKPYLIPQHFGQFNDNTVAGALRIEKKLKALQEILKGNVSEKYLDVLNEDWSIEERCNEALSYWNLENISLHHKMESLSGGEKTKVFLAGIFIHQPDIILLDEPTNHLDVHSREVFYNYIKTCNKTLLAVSHDRIFLELLQPVYELDKRGVTMYGGNYSFYREQKQTEENALYHSFEDKEKALQKAKREERKALERKQKQDARGKKKQERAGAPRILMNKLKNDAESSDGRLKNVHSEKVSSLSGELSDARRNLPDIQKMKMNFESSALHKGKILVKAQQINFGYTDKMIWNNPLDFVIRSGERINIRGRNGSGKTTLIKLMLGDLEPKSGVIERADLSSVYIDQDYSLIKNHLTVYEQAQEYNYNALKEHDIRIRLYRYLFDKEFLNKPCSTLSGGEKMRLMLCCMMIGNHAPDLFVLDEPTNNLDIRNIEILASAINEYNGTVIVVSHDTLFLKEIKAERKIELD